MSFTGHVWLLQKLELRFFKIQKMVLLKDTSKVFQFVEVFAGEAQCTRMFRFADMPSARLDLKYMTTEGSQQNPMNLLSDSGMATLGMF